jgi:hypothetical protein
VAEALPTLGTRPDRAVPWGIAGTGGIAAALAADLRVAREAGEFVAVASRARAAIGLRYPGEVAA